MNLVFGQDAFIKPWVAERIPYCDGFDDTAVTIGIADGEKLIAGWVYHLFCGADIHIAVAADSPKWATRGILAGLFHYPFIQLGCRRVTAITPKYNARARKFALSLGFRLEGKMRQHYDGKDAIVYGMLKHECKWIKHDLSF